MGEGTVLVRRSSLGDVVLLGAITAAVPGPTTVVTHPRWVEVAERLRGVHAVVPWGDESIASVAARLPSGTLVDLQGSVATRRLARAHRGPSRRLRKHSLRRRLRLVRAGAGRPAVTSLYAAAAGVAPESAPWLDLPAAPRDTLALVPGAAWATKRWDPRRLGAVGASWDGPVVVLGGPDDAALVDVVVEHVPAARRVCEVGFERTLEVLPRVAVAVGGDTGLVHLAAAAGARVVVLMGPTHTDDGFQAHPGVRIGRPLACRPCALHGRHRCPLGHHRCLGDVGVDEVIAGVAAARGQVG